MWTDIKRFYADAGAFAKALPLLFLIPALIEFAQHVVEIKIGMYGSREAAKAVADDSARMAFGFAKTLGLLLPGYWFTRYMAWGRDAVRARTFEMPAVGLFAVTFAIGAVEQYLALFGPSFGALIGLAGKQAMMAGALLKLVEGLIGIYLMAWFVAWPLGNAAIGPIRSVRIMTGSFWRTIGYIIAGSLPMMIVHYGFGYGAMGRPVWLVWGMMAVDALGVGYMALLMAGASYVAAAHAAAKKQVSLLP